ncbi:hypothetical protein Sjap_000661 [Stephania japonica]|uniref:CCAAT-binding factor domain-containing protein n=1 Tax=Stephania japonica TaxID=461633 RepID=A0AAP0KIH6_9MAGN
MATSKPGKPENPKTPKDIELLKSDVASFASSLGLSSAPSSNSGFNDSDFRKKSSLQLKNPNPRKPSNPNHAKSQNEKTESKKTNAKQNKFRRNDRPRDSAVSVDSRPFDRWKNLPKLPLMKASALGQWFVEAEELEGKVVGREGRSGGVGGKSSEWMSSVAKKKELGERLMAQYALDYEVVRGNDREIKMVFTAQRSGTAVDKVSAFSLLVGDNPIANLRSLDALLAMVTSKVGKRHALSGFESLKELFLSCLLPDRKLKLLIQRPLDHLPESKDGNSLLLFWYWEDCLKQRYERFVFALEEASRDMLPILKDKSLKMLYALLSNKSEQERRLLSALVNKLGDPENKGASNADFYLSKLLTDHPNMKEVVINEVDSFLFRPHLNLRAKYHAVNFLSQIRLSHKGDGPKVAKRMMDVYFALFKGVNRAFPFLSSGESDDLVEVQTPMLFKLVHSKNFNVGVQALMLLDKISTKNQVVSDRFYRALYSKLLLPAVIYSSKKLSYLVLSLDIPRAVLSENVFLEMFIGLLLRAIKNDINLKRVSAFSKRLLQVALQQPPQFACGCLFLLSEVLKARPPLWNMVLQSESIDADLEHFEDILEEPESDVGTAPSVNGNENHSAKTESNSSESESEDGIPDSVSSDDLSEGEDILGKHGANAIGEVITASDHDKSQPQAPNMRLPVGYDPRHREPSYCNAEHVSWWELMVLASHVHPSVATMAMTLLSGTNIVYNGNPLNDLSLTAFLDKFMEKKPKQTAWHGGSQIEPAKKLDMNNHLIGAEILALAEADVPPEDVVFHKFYMNKMVSSKKPKKKKQKKSADDINEDLLGDDINEDLLGGDGSDESDVEVGGDESDNEEIENMLDSADVPSDNEGDYDYDDLDEVANEDDEDLIGNGSDADVDVPSDLAEEADDDDDDIGQIDIGYSFVDDNDDDLDDDDHVDKHSSNKRKRNNKSKARTGKSPFASVEDYVHLLKADEDDPMRKEPKSKKPKSRKRRKSSD